MPYEQQARLLFAQMDANGDGELSLHEMRAYIELKGEEPLANELFAELDTNQDGVVSFEEFLDGFDKVRRKKTTSRKLTTKKDVHALPLLSVRNSWLRQFVKRCKSKTYSWTAKDFLRAEHGGGGKNVIQVSADNLQVHRERINAAGRDGDGKPTSVQYNSIPFELMTTNDVCFGIVKPATEHVRTSYAEMLSNTQPREVQKATVFVSHAWKYTFVNVVDALSKCLRECLRVVRRVHR